MDRPDVTEPGVTIFKGDARDLDLPDDSVDLIVTSPPYFGLRSYQDGGEHYAEQIGAEATPAEFVDALIECTREWMRVVKPSGSIWVNLGDRYSDGTPLDNELTVGDAGWLAGLIDADGTITVRRTQQKQMRAPTFEGIISVEQMDRDAVDRCKTTTGLGKVHEVKGSRGRTMYRWTVSTQQARWVAERIWPFLRIKHRQAKAIVELGKHREQCQARGRHTPIKPEWVEYRQLICDAVRAWNRREPHEWEPPALPVVELPLRPHFLPAKSLAGIPWRYAIRCVDELGLILRAEVIWSKPNGLPESVTDRVRRSHETWFHFTLEPRYYSAVDEVREAHKYGPGRGEPSGVYSVGSGRNDAGTHGSGGFVSANPLGKLPGSVWTVATEPLQVPDHLGVDHFAAFPAEWPRRIIQGWSPRGVCVECGAGRRPVTRSLRTRSEAKGAARREASNAIGGGFISTLSDERNQPSAVITGEACDCPETTAPTTPGVVLDPFGGTGTTALVASVLGRRGISNDMSSDYNRIAEWRTTDPKQRAKAARKPYTPAAEQTPGQLDLFDIGDAS